MRIERLALKNWRAVQSFDIQFAQGITIVEGPNEIGKSSIIEALYTLFKELDSSNKQSVKAVQPVGQDVGSEVEVEIYSGEYHFVYKKTYNRNKQTDLRIISPQPHQFTGREAHERAEEILEGTMDMTLWNALLVEQGKEVEGAKLSESRGLAQALDQVAGASPYESESDLFSVIQAEYGKYFTLRANNYRFAEFEQETAGLGDSVEDIRNRFLAVESDIDTYERTLAEINRIQSELPDLKEDADKHEAEWRAIRDLQEKLNDKKSERDSAQQLLQASIDDQERRKTLIEEVSSTEKAAKEAEALIQPLSERVELLKTDRDNAKTKLDEKKEEYDRADVSLKLARADAQYLLWVDGLERETARLEKLEEYQASAREQTDILSGIKVTAEGLNEIRETEKAVQIAISRRDSAKSVVSIEAKKNLDISLNDETTRIEKDKNSEINVSSELRVVIPDIALIQVKPSQSASELEEELNRYQEALNALFDAYDVGDLAAAIATDARRVEAKSKFKQWRDQIDVLLGDDREGDIRERVDSLTSQCNEYISGRTAESDLPASRALAEQIIETAEQLFDGLANEVSDLQENHDRLNDDHHQAAADLRVASQEVSGLKQVHQDKKGELTKSREVTSDQALDEMVAEREKHVNALTLEEEGLDKQVEESSPETAEALHINSKDTLERAEKDLQEHNTQSAVLEDRLKQAQASGLYEQLDEAERKLEVMEAQCEATRKRANAIKRLWDTFNRYRNAAREAYVRPLREGIEQLGRIVFGSSFSVVLDNDWALVSRTLNGDTIVYDDLSIGAKEQIGILTRLAAARIVSSQEGVPLIIDDALGFSDPSRLQTMGAAIASAGNDCQIILLTCTPGRFMHVGNASVVRLQ